MKQLLAGLAWMALSLAAWGQTYSFGVPPQGDPALAASYWNPILGHVSRKSGIKLELATRPSREEHAAAEAGGEFDFVFGNRFLAPGDASAQYQIIAAMAGPPLLAQIAVSHASAARTLPDLAGSDVGFPGRDAFITYAVPAAELARAGVAVKPVFAADQEDLLAQLQAGRIAAAAVTPRALRNYAARENFEYRVLWTSPPHLHLPLAVHARVPAPAAGAVRLALIGMVRDAEGREILKASAELIRQESPLGFAPARHDDYLTQAEALRGLWKFEGR